MIRVGPSLGLSFLLAVGCQPPQATDAGTHQPVVELPKAGVSTTEMPAPSAKAHLEVECRVRAAELESEVPVRFDASSPPLLWARHASAVLSIRTASRADASLELELEGIVLETPYVPEDLPLRPARPIVFARHVIPDTRAILGLVAASAGSVVVSYRLSDAFVERETVQTEAPCEALALTQHHFEPETALVVGKETGEMSLSKGASVPFFADPTGLEVGRHRLAEDSSVSTYASASGRTLVTLSTADELLFGWVPTTALSSSLGSIGLGSIGTGGHGLGLRGRSNGDWMTCDHEIELFARNDGRQAPVGKIRPDTRFEPQREEGELTRVDFWISSLRMAPGTQLAVRTSDLETCRKTD